MGLLDPVTALRRWGGVVDGTTLRRVCGDGAVRSAVSSGRITRLARNSYALPGADEALAAAGRLHGTVSHLSAARAWSWKVKTVPLQPHVTVPRNRNVDAERRGSVHLHWSDVPAGEVAGRCTSRVRTVVDCARSLPFDEALSVADSALRDQTVTREQLLAADGRADNPFESCLRAIALDVPGWSPQAQPHVPGVGHADVGEAAARLVLEAESFEFHALPEAFAYDLRRYTAMVRAGWVVLRFGWDELMHRPDEVRATIEAVLRRQQRAVRACPRCSAA